jgi:SAM-dependent methyltransferase
MRESYSQRALDELLADVAPRRGWDFSSMKVLRQPVPWNYKDLVPRYLRRADYVLDVGTGGGETLTALAGSFGHGLGIDLDPEMVRLAAANSAAGNLDFRVCSERLESVPETFDVIIDRHAPFDLAAVAAHLKPGGYFITQQVGERNMACVKAALGQPAGPPAIQRDVISASGLRLLAFMEYDVEYVVRDIQSLLFWLNALDSLHADIEGSAALASAATLNRVLAGNVDERGFVTNEHRYLAIAQLSGQRLDDPGHDPAVLADLTVTGEPELLVGRQSAVVEEAGGHRPGGLGVSLDRPPAQARDEIERAGERCRSHALAPVPLTDIAARDPPIRRCRPAFFVRGQALDPGHFLGCAELAPADAVLPLENERGVGFALPDPLFLRSTFLRHTLPHIVGPGLSGVEAHAPAAAEDAVVALNQRGKRGPGRFVKSLHGVRRSAHGAEFSWMTA